MNEMYSSLNSLCSSYNFETDSKVEKLWKE